MGCGWVLWVAGYSLLHRGDRCLVEARISKIIAQQFCEMLIIKILN